MKKMLLVVLSPLFFSQNVLASSLITDSQYDLSHQQVIVEAIAQFCNLPSRPYRQISSSSRVIKVDQGIRDIEYTTEIGIREYSVTVTSYYSDFSNPMDANHYSVVNLDSAYCN